MAAFTACLMRFNLFHIVGRGKKLFVSAREQTASYHSKLRKGPQEPLMEAARPELTFKLGVSLMPSHHDKLLPILLPISTLHLYECRPETDLSP